MATNGSEDPPAESGCTFYLVSSGDEVDSYSTNLEEQLDNVNGIQARVTVSDCVSNDAYDTILRAAKIGSRWGKDLDETYRDAVRGLVKTSDDPQLVENLEQSFERHQADVYEAELTGEAVSIGVGVADALEDEFDRWTSLRFGKDDLAAAAGFAHQESSNQNPRAGDIIIESSSPFSERRNSIGQLVAIIQQLVLMGFRVLIVAPQGQSNETTVVNEIFKRLSQFTLVDETGHSIDVTEEVESFVDHWYDRLCYDVSDKKVSERVIRPVSVTLYDLPDDELGRHFSLAIRDGLQNAYSEKQFDKDQFRELWRERVTPHENYDKYRSKHADFPRVTIARSDGITREFELHHEGPQARPHLDGIPLESTEPEKELIDLVVRFLNAEQISEGEWNDLEQTAKETIGAYTTSDIDSTLTRILLRRRRKRADLGPLVTAEDKQRTSRDLIRESEYGSDWYSENWATILSGYEITKSFGTNIIADKRELQRSLDGSSAADSALYYKLERDIQNAWTVYVEGVQNGVKQNLPEEIDTDIEVAKTSSGKRIEFQISTPSGDTLSTSIDIYLPYSDVHIDGEPIRQATVSKTVTAVLDTFEDLLYERSEQAEEQTADGSRVLYNVIQFYIEVTECNEGDLVYFDDLIQFCRLLPGVWERFNTPTTSVEESLREAFSDETLIQQLREDGARFHRKGSDDHGSIKVPQNRYIAFEVVDKLLPNRQ